MPPPAPQLVLSQVLRLLRPLVRLLVRSGVTYTALAAALKPLFVEAAQHTLQRQNQPATDSTLSLLSGVHRRDLRQMLRGTSRSLGPSPAPHAEPGQAPPTAPGLPAELVARWLHEPRFCTADGLPRVLARGTAEPDSFDALVTSISLDVRPRAMLDTLLQLGVVDETTAGVQLRGLGFAPRGTANGTEALARLMADNLHDHAAAASANLLGDANFLEQALFVDQLAPDSVQAMRGAARQAWQQAFKTLMASAQTRFDADQALPAEQRRQRVRVGIYFYNTDED